MARTKDLTVEINKQIIYLGTGKSEVIDIILVLAKQYIYRTRFRKDSLNVLAFKNYLDGYINLEFNVAKRKGTVALYYEKWEKLL